MEREEQAKEFLGMHGHKPSKYWNGLALAVPSRDQVGILRRAVRYLMAIEQLRSKAKQYNLTEEQTGRLKEREGTEKAGAESAFLKLCSEVWFPKIEDGKIETDSVSLGGRPLQTMLHDKKQVMIHEWVMDLITVVQQKVFFTTTPGKVISLFKVDDFAWRVANADRRKIIFSRKAKTRGR